MAEEAAVTVRVDPWLSCCLDNLVLRQSDGLKESGRVQRNSAVVFAVTLQEIGLWSITDGAELQHESRSFFLSSTSSGLNLGSGGDKLIPANSDRKEM